MNKTIESSGQAAELSRPNRQARDARVLPGVGYD